MKRILVSIKKKVDPSHKLISTEWVNENEINSIKKNTAINLIRTIPLSAT